jgi:hypothetical protein
MANPAMNSIVKNKSFFMEFSGLMDKRQDMRKPLVTNIKKEVIIIKKIVYCGKLSPGSISGSTSKGRVSCNAFIRETRREMPNPNTPIRAKE